MVRALPLAMFVALAAVAGLFFEGPQVSAQGNAGGEITVLSVQVSPGEPTPGDVLAVTAEVTNTGPTAVEQEVEMLANGQVVASQMVSLGPGESRQITFSFQVFVAGEVQIAVGDVTELVTVAESAPTVEAPTPAPAPTEAPGPTEAPAPTVAPTSVSPSEGRIRVGPSVRLDTRQGEIDRERNAVIDLFWSNSELNELAVRIEVAIDVPTGLYLYSQDGSLACSAGRCLKSVDALPGTVRSFPITVKADKTGDYFIQLIGRYWPIGDPDRWNPINLSTTIKVLEPSIDPTRQPGPETTPPPPPSPVPTGVIDDPEPSPTWWLRLEAIIVYGLIALVVVVLGGYKAISKAVKNSRSRVEIG